VQQDATIQGKKKRKKKKKKKRGISKLMKSSQNFEAGTMK
jgi:hypothetical protein